METKGFFASLYDFSFTSLITTKIIRGVYALIVTLIGLIYLVAVLRGFSDGVGSGLTILVLGAIASLLFSIYVRIGLECIVAVFRIMETNVEIAEQGRRPASGTSGQAVDAAPTGSIPPA
ncbi:MAG: DUF4282 domain-containing protein [Patulibacter sp.]